ncbi:MAG: NAD-dependent epimerase/dehydratase family protein [Actinobacteria bacterium]|nr:NAD-dependent epimerase/dehydratase family protein [Actinomycetota bacterium]MSV84896.1 NAD-dependent epimerase/dehydratase family protein [Actinomycetota bacterium]MSY21708.1 NAD-dependent epimerase/dehydratase family protein [Actinomycetota bacterium]MTA74751.1 NAD-dependent epimerase/dehydratase family protein [Actinomycetota bacterium]
MLGLWLATLLRYELQFGAVDTLGVLALGSIAMVAQVVLGRLGGLYVHRWRYGTFDEIVGTLKVVAMVTVLVAAADAFSPGVRPVPVSAAIVSGFVALAIMCIGRLVWRQKLEKWTRVESDDRLPIIVIGAGSGGLQVITAMIKSGPYHPVAVIDDNPDLRNLRIKGVKVGGDRSSLAQIVEQTGAKHIIIAIPSASGEFIRDVAKRADELELRTLILPPVDEMFGIGVNLGDIRPLTEADLLGRRELSLDIESVAGYLTGKRVLVTGAGGSIGSELCRQIHRFAPESLVMLDRDESALQAVQISIEGRGLLDSRDLVVCCIRDSDRLRQVFEEHRPEVVFHAAALKHLPLLEMHAEEGWKTNVWGTQNLLELAGEFGVDRFVNISTDKAADASSVLGQTKRIAEQLTSHAGKEHSGTYLSVRFGNVLGSRGSVLPLFREQIAQGGPITVTHPEVTRFFMTIPEACELVIQAGALSHDGEVLVLDMGEPVKIADLARRLIAECDRQVEIVYTGLRPGEKMHEVLFSPTELPSASEHPMIQRVEVPSMSPTVAALKDPFLVDPVIDVRSSRYNFSSDPRSGTEKESA